MKYLKAIASTAVVQMVAIECAWAQYGAVGGDDVTSTLERTIGWLQVTAVSILAIYVIINFIRMGKDDEEGPRAKKHVVMGLVGMAGVMLLKGIVNLIQQLTQQTFTAGF